MTRWARNKSAQKHGKLPSDSTPWSELKAPITHDGKLNLKPNVAKIKKRRVNSFLELDRESDDSSMKKRKIRKPVNSFTVIPYHSNESKKKDIKIAKVKGFDNKKSPSRKSIEGSGIKELTQKEKVEKKQKNLEKMIKKRNEKGIQLLSQKVERKIYNMKRGMRKKGMSGDEIKEAVRNFRRKEELRFRKESGRLCLRCRKPGHKVAECREILDDHEQSMGVCFKCGSTEHKLSQCSVPAQKGGTLPFAKCFVCGGLGHLSSGCAKNPKGKYPKGGSCKICSSVNHFASECPQDQRILENEPTASTIVQGLSADMDSIEDNKNFAIKPRKTVISF